MGKLIARDRTSSTLSYATSIAKEAVDLLVYQWHGNSVVFDRLGKYLCLVAIVGLFEGHLMMAQSWAWITMLQDRAPVQGITTALETTFSGNAPCSICCAVQQERQDREKEAPVPESKPAAKYAPSISANRLMLFPPASSHLLIASNLERAPVGQRARPPSPPPRVG